MRSGGSFTNRVVAGWVGRVSVNTGGGRIGDQLGFLRVEFGRSVRVMVAWRGVVCVGIAMNGSLVGRVNFETRSAGGIEPC